MIRVKVERDRQGRIEAFRVDGHAGFADVGEDIVCAAVSVLVQNGVNSIEALLGVKMPAVSRDGLVECHVPVLSEPVSGQVQLLLESMVYGLRALADEYPQHVSVFDRNSIDS
ncbi:ribosomal-processing cysteine protease Prp [Effusibacillus pohliae]|uniref:ribosomal-processing cysteine protease Prp n=1 Tax=Effusibacillus pohliae TaxID=232270 RepID=UPI00037D509E|nr:ribosomal-processing cysteine protease Prp [Effusibacillus pohliae]